MYKNYSCQRLSVMLAGITLHKEQQVLPCLSASIT
nr:MAG TPA: hypothetical protein [Caudoviricetes sp.]